MDKFLTAIKTKYCSSSRDQKQYPPRYSSEPVKLELKGEHKSNNKRGEHKPTSIYPDPQLVPYRDIFKKEKEQVVRKVLIEGGAGMGKTTFCLSISENWANKELFEKFKVLLLLPLHDTRIATTSTLAELIETLQVSENLSASVAASIEESKGEGVLLVADGWDKLNVPICLRTFLDDLLFGRILNLASIIVTSRPSHSEWLCKNGCFDRLLSIHGFGDEKIRQYIQLDFIDSQQESDRLLKIVDCNSWIKSMCRIPLNCATLCHLWHTTSQEQKFSITGTVAELCNKMRLNAVFHSIECLPKELKEIMIDFIEIVNKAKYDSLCPAIQEYLAVANQGHSTCIQDEKQVTDFLRFLFGICGQSTSNLALLERAILSLSKFDHLRCLICHCAVEAKNSVIDEKAIEALSTPSGSKHFGDPKTIHDCEAILYVIEQMGNIDAQLELNFKDCNFKEEQLCILTKILAKFNEDNKIKIKSFDLSNKSNLPNRKVAELFKKALTAFQSLQKLSLRNNEMGKNTGPDGDRYTMRALGSLKCLIQLDLSCNRLTIRALEVFHENIKCYSLAQLEILLLQAAFTSDAEKNITFLKTFTQSLPHYCRKLQKLDISGNDLGEQGSPVVSTVIRTLTLRLPGLNLDVDPKYESEVDKGFVNSMEDLVRRQKKIDYTVIHGVIVGPGRSGKNSLMDRLMGKCCPKALRSTGVAENVVKVVIKRSCAMAGAETNLEWRRLEYCDEALELMMITVITNIDALAEKVKPIPGLIAQLDESTSIECALLVVESETKNEGESKTEMEKENEIDSGKEKKAVPEVDKGAVSDIDDETNVSSGMPKPSYSKEFNLRKGSRDIFKRAVELRHESRHSSLHELRECIESKCSLYLTNTGGQLEFQELMPLLVCGPSVFFITVPLHFELDKPYHVPFKGLKSSEEPYWSSSTLMEEILQTLATIATLDITGPQLGEVNHKPKVFFVGTHKDQVMPKSSESVNDIIRKIDGRLQESIEQTLLYKQRSIEYAESPNQLMFTVNNLEGDDGDFRKIRLAVQRMVDRRNRKDSQFTISCPCSWLVFSLYLRAKLKSHQVLNYDECFAAAKSCEISIESDFQKALLFIHHRLGLIRYYAVEGLNDRVIIDPQIIFDTITKLMKETFISEHADAIDVKEFRTMGIFSIKLMKDINSKIYHRSQLPFVNEWVPKLLDHLGIAVFFDQDGEEKCFLPCMLCRASEHQGSNALNCSIKAPPPISIAFKSGFCPRAIFGTLVKSLMNNELKPLIYWKLRRTRIFRNQVSFGVGPADIILKILPTHIEISLDAESDQSLSEREVNITCEEAYKQIRKVMSHIVNVKFRKCDHYPAFYCTLSECKECPHPAMIDWDTNQLECGIKERKSDLPDDYDLWIQIRANQEGN